MAHNARHSHVPNNRRLPPSVPRVYAFVPMKTATFPVELDEGAGLLNQTADDRPFSNRA